MPRQDSMSESHPVIRYSEATVIFLSPPYILQDSQFTNLLTSNITQISLQKRGIGLIASTPLTWMNITGFNITSAALVLSNKLYNVYKLYHSSGHAINADGK
jgi:hypothetical protein